MSNSICCLQMPVFRYLPDVFTWATSSVIPSSAMRAHGVGIAGVMVVGTGLLARCLRGGHHLTWPLPLVPVGIATCHSAIVNFLRDSVSKEDRNEVEKLIIQQRKMREPANALQLMSFLSYQRWQVWKENVKAMSVVQRRLAMNRNARSKPRTWGNLLPRLFRFFQLPIVCRGGLGLCFLLPHICSLFFGKHTWHI